MERRRPAAVAKRTFLWQKMNSRGDAGKRAYTAQNKSAREISPGAFRLGATNHHN
jgi:hypothetical protein